MRGQRDTKLLSKGHKISTRTGQISCCYHAQPASSKVKNIAIPEQMHQAVAHNQTWRPLGSRQLVLRRSRKSLQGTLRCPFYALFCLQRGCHDPVVLLAAGRTRLAAGAAVAHTAVAAPSRCGLPPVAGPWPPASLSTAASPSTSTTPVCQRPSAPSFRCC